MNENKWDELERFLKGLVMTPENRDDYGDNYAAYCQFIFDKPELLLELIAENKQLQAERDELAAQLKSSGNVDIYPSDWIKHAKGDGWNLGSIAPSENGLYERFFVDGVYIHDFYNGNWFATFNGKTSDLPHWRQVGDYPCWIFIPTQSVDGIVDALLSGGCDE